MHHRLIIVLIALGTAVSCSTRTQFIIVNENNDRRAVDFRLMVDNDTLFDSTITWTDIRPDLRYIVGINVSPGNHRVKMVADSGRLEVLSNLEIKDDTWCFINYSGAEACRSWSKEMGRKIFPGNFDTILIYKTNKKPIHL